MSAKILFQQLWKIGLNRDDSIPMELEKQFKSWLEDISVLKQWRIPRKYTCEKWSQVRDMKLDVFCDASELAYGVVVYLKTSVNNEQDEASPLVISKARVAPLKKLTVPRLELMGALLAARLVNYVKTALKIPDVTYNCYTDSKVVLSWIKSEPSKWKMFVANLVTEIQNTNDPALWLFCPGESNPADLLTRGVSAKQLINSDLWLTGPSTSEISVVPGENKDIEMPAEKSEEDELLLVALSKVEEPVTVFEVDRWGSFLKAVRVVAWVRRFIQNARKQNITNGDLNQEEMEESKIVLYKHSQKLAFPEEVVRLKQGKDIPKSSKLYVLNPYVDETGLLRVKARLEMSNLTYAEKFPIIMNNGWLSRLIAEEKHQTMKHAGVGTVVTSLRNEFWIIGLRRLVKGIIRRCLVCQKLSAPSCNQPSPPLR